MWAAVCDSLVILGSDQPVSIDVLSACVSPTLLIHHSTPVALKSALSSNVCPAKCRPMCILCSLVVRIGQFPLFVWSDFRQQNTTMAFRFFHTS